MAHRCLEIAPTEAFGQYSLLGFSASHLGWEKGGKAPTIARRCQALAYSGLQGVEVVSSENSEVVLAATTLLLWQAPNRLSWQQLRNELSNVREAMKPWAHESPLARHHGVAGLVRTPQPALISEYRVRLLRVLSELRSRFEESGQSDKSLRIRSIRDMESSLQSIEQNFEDREPLLEIRILDLSAPSQDPSRLSNAHHEFLSQIHVVRSLVLWLPPSIVDTETIKPLDLVLLALVYAGALMVELSLPEGGDLCLGELSLRTLLSDQIQLAEAISWQELDPTLQNAICLTDRIAATYEQAREPVENSEIN
ncbi:uncharacterized protein PV06_11712 [Exophiala oligosperma]|uniref:Uncharacterized protein n=1 Tax=Exophiala oligosperma TaxID=215243 RepID=A0A0D2BEU3_9EURO|nr:uncharacterized protein PV06_11712 [Exophiala oligosperma]KIW35992.1 hypothetical protein PV06_11712 [Exophiala oligosperma]